MPAPWSSGKPPAILLGRTLNVLGAVRGLARHGVRPIVVTDSRQDPVLKSRYPIACHVVHPATGPALLQLLDRYRNQGLVIIATGDETVAFLGRHAAALEADFRFVLPPKRAIDLFTDKRAETAAMRSLGIPLPRTVGRMPLSARQVAELIDLPLLIKARSEADRRVLKAKNYAVRTSAELDAFYAAHGRHLDHVIAQEIIPGGDDHLWGCNCVFGHDSRLLQAFTFNRLGTAPPHYGVTSFAISKANAEIVSHAEKIGRLIDYVGPAMFEFKYDSRDGTYKYLETNPRLGMTNFFDACCGVNNMAMIYELALNGKTAAASMPAVSSTGQDNGVVFIDLFQDVISRMQDGERPGSILRRYGRYLGRRRVGAYWYWRDPLPALYLVARGVWRRIGGEALVGRWALE
jgi:D-aspartate ligase